MADLSSPPPQPQLIRQVSERTSALDFVGLSSFRDDLVEQGLQSVDDFPRFTDTDLERLGMSVVQRNIYRLLLAHSMHSTAPQRRRQQQQPGSEASSAAAKSNSSPSSSTKPRSRGWETVSPNAAPTAAAVAAESALDECPMCEEEPATERQQCCGFSCCGDCFRGHLVHAEGWHSCPNPSCKVPLDATVTAKLLVDHCCVCGEGRAVGQPELRSVGCGYDHRAHDACLEQHLSVFIGRKKFPVVCPAFEVCKCPLPEATVLAVLDPKASSSAVVSSPSTPATSSMVAAEIDDHDPSVVARATALHKYYNLAIDHAAAAHPNRKECPNSLCAGVIDLGPLAGARVVGAGYCGVKCNSCDTTWCAACWQPAHVGLDCEEFGKARGEWLDFVGRQGGAAAEDVAREMRNYRDMLASEEFKASNMRHCPHCGLEVFRTDGCSDVTCGRDASDKGNALHSNLGCGEHFNWDRARRYKAKVKPFVPSATAGSGDVAVRTDGVLVPPRICRLCFGAVHRGTCFEEVSAAARRIGADPFELLLYADAKLRKKRYVPAAAFDCPGVNVHALGRALIPSPHPKGAVFQLDAKNKFKAGLPVVSFRASSGGPTSGWWGNNGDESDWETWSGRPGEGVLGISRGSSYSGRVYDVRGNWFRFVTHTNDNAWVPIATCEGFQGYNQRDAAAAAAAERQSVMTLRLAVGRMLWGSATAPTGAPHVDPIHVSEIRVHVNAPASKGKAPEKCTTSLHIDIASAIPDKRVRQAVLEAVNPQPRLTKERDVNDAVAGGEGGGGAAAAPRVEHAEDIDDGADGTRHRRRRVKRRNQNKRERVAPARKGSRSRERKRNDEIVDLEQLVLKLPPTRLPKARGWATLFSRQSALKALRSTIGHIVGVDVLLKLLESTKHVELSFRCRNGATECILEQLEFSTCPTIPVAVRGLLKASADVTAAAGSSDVSGFSGAAADICICWPCMRGQFSDAHQEDGRSSDVQVGDWVTILAHANGPHEVVGVVTKIPSTTTSTWAIQKANTVLNLSSSAFRPLVLKTQSVFAVGDVVTLSSTFRSSSNLNAANGPLRKIGDTGVVIAVQPDEDDAPQPIRVRSFSGQDFWYCKSALQLVSSDTVSRDSLPAIQLAQAFSNGAALDSVCRLIEPLSGETLQSWLSSLNRGVLRIPEAYFNQPGTGLMGSASNSSHQVDQSADAIDIADRMAVVVQLVLRYSCKEVDAFALRSFQYLLECLDQQICLMSGPTLGVTKLRTVRKVCCDILAIAGKWVRQRERLSDALKIERGDNDKDTAATEEFAALDFESAQSSLLVKAFQCFTQVRSRCLDVGLEGFHAHQQKKSSEIGKDDPAPVNADQISGAEFVEGHTLGVRAESIIRPGLRLFHRRDHRETEITSVSSSTFTASGRAGVYSFANMYSIFLVDRLSAYRKAKAPRKPKLLKSQQNGGAEELGGGGGGGDDDTGRTALSALPPLLRAKVNAKTVLSAAYSLWLELEICDRGENTSETVWQDPPEGTDYDDDDGDDTYDRVSADEPEEWEVLESVNVHSEPSDAGSCVQCAPVVGACFSASSDATATATATAAAVALVDGAIKTQDLRTYTV